ncbi:MAG: hypothetical protein V1834_01780 [Candidatus Micrarchaeota archaeon]
MAKPALEPKGYLDVLGYYSVVARKLTRYLKGKEIAAKNWIPGMRFQILKRGSKQKPLFIEDLAAAVNDGFLELRKLHLKEARSKLSEKQALAWEYFVPRKLSDLLYATNNEGAGKPIERVFLDLDKGAGVTSEQAQEACRVLVSVIGKKWGKPSVFWTGSSFHVFLFFSKPKPNAFYNQNFYYTKSNPLASLTGKWAAEVAKEVGFEVEGGHEKKKGVLNIDPSQTPSGKLCRAPFSLHMKDANTIDGIDIPLTVEMLGEKGLVKDLRTYDAGRVINELNDLAKRLPF